MIKYLVILFVSLSFTSLSQPKKVDTLNFDSKVLNGYLIKLLNSDRKRKKQSYLTTDSSLIDMTKNHVNYMANHNYVGHNQNQKSKEFVSSRLEYYGGNHQNIDEIVASIDLRKLYLKNKGRLTYHKLSKIMYDKWKKAGSNSKIILDPNYVGYTIEHQLKSGFLYSCMTFGSKPFLDHYPYQKGDDIFIKNKKPCYNCKKVRKKVDNDKGHMGWYSVSNDSIYYLNIKKYAISHKSKLFSLRKYKNNKNLIFNHHGIVTIDLIHHEQIDCDGKPAYDRSLYHDGYYLGYVDKGMLANNISTSPNMYKIYIAQVPAFVDTFYQVDLNYSKKWKPCTNNKIIYVNPDFFTPQEFFTIPKPEVTLNNQIIIRDSIQIKVPFKRNQTNEDSTIFTPLSHALDSIVKLNYTLKTIFYTGVASIEGNEKSNTKLIKKRGLLIKRHLLKTYPNIDFQSKYYENFEDFRDGLGLIGYKEIAQESDENMRRWANTNRDETKVSELLNTTRQSVVTIHFEDEIIPASPDYSFSVQHIKDLIKNNDPTNAAIFFQIMAHKAFEDNTIKDSLLTLDLPKNKAFKTINWNYFVFELNVTNHKVDYEKLNDLLKIGAIKSTDQFLEYRLLFNIFNSNTAIKVDDFGETLPKVKRKQMRAWLEILELISGVQNYRYQPQMAQPIITSLALKQKLNVQQTYFVCQYLISWGYTVEPYLLLSKFARKKGLFPKLYKQHIKLAYYLQLFDNPREWKKIKITLKNLGADYPEDYCDLFKWHQMGVRALENKEVAKIFCENCR